MAEEKSPPDSKELENLLQAQNPQNDAKKPEPKHETPLEEIVNGFSSAAKAALAFAVPYTFAAQVPSFARDTAILAGAQAASDLTLSYKNGKKYTAGNLLESTVLGTAMTPILEGMFGAANSVPTTDLMGYVAKAGVWGGLCYPGFVAAYQPLAYFIRNRTFKGMGKYIKENYWPTLKTAWTKLLPFSLLNVFFAPSWLQIPVSAGLSYVFDLFGAPHKEEIKEHQKRDKTSYLSALSSITGKLARNVYSIPNAAYSIGNSLRSLYKTAPKAPAPAPAQ